MGIRAIFNFLLYALINASTPGPGNLLALNTTVRYGWKKGRKLLAGVFAGYFSVQTLCTLFVFGLDQFLNPVISVIKYVGAGYILWLALHVLRSKPDFTGAEQAPSFWTGFILQFVNVKIYLFGITALTGYVIPFYSSFPVLFFFAVVIASIGSIATLTWGVLDGVFQNFYTRHYRPINIVLALALVECVVSLIIL